MQQPNAVIRPYENSDFDAFAQMVGVCWIEDYKETLNNNPPVGMCKSMVQSAADGIMPIDLICLGDSIIGFIMYQIDTPKSDWCQKEGYGCIREMYIQKDYRKQGYGKILVAHAENELKKLSAQHIYITADDDNSIAFWQCIGYADTGEICEANNGNILIKQV